MKKSKKEAQQVVQELIAEAERERTHLQRVKVAQDAFTESLKSLKWIVESAAYFLPPDQLQTAVTNVQQYAGRLENLAEAQLSLIEDHQASIALYQKLVKLIPDSLWKKD